MHAFGQLPQAGIFLVVLMNPALNGLHLIVLMIGMCRQPGVDALQIVTHIDDKRPGQFPGQIGTAEALHQQDGQITPGGSAPGAENVAVAGNQFPFIQIHLRVAMAKFLAEAPVGGGRFVIQ